MITLEVDGSAGTAAATEASIVGTGPTFSADGMNVAGYGKCATGNDPYGAATSPAGTLIAAAAAGTAEEVGEIGVTISLATGRNVSVLTGANNCLGTRSQSTVTATAGGIAGSQTGIDPTTELFAA